MCIFLYDPITYDSRYVCAMGVFLCLVCAMGVLRGYKRGIIAERLARLFSVPAIEEAGVVNRCAY